MADPVTRGCLDARPKPVAKPCKHVFVTSEGTRHGSVMTRFAKACEERDVFRAETAAREMGHMSLPNALRLVCLYAAVDSDKFEPAAVRFLGRLSLERRGQTLS